MAVNNFFYVKSANRSQFFRMWVEMLTPWHHLTSREKDVFARIIEQYFILKNKVEDENLITEFLWTNSSRKDIRDSLGMSQPHFQMILASLRKQEVLLGEKINPRFLPHLTDEPRLGLFVGFDWSSVNNPIDAG